MRFLKGEFIIRSKSRPSMYGHVVYVTSDTVLISGTRPLGHSASGRCGGHFARTLCESKTINIHDRSLYGPHHNSQSELSTNISQPE